VLNGPDIDVSKSFTGLLYTLFPLVASLTYIQIINKGHICYIANTLLILAFINIIVSFFQIRINYHNLTQLKIGAIFSDRNMYARFLVVATSYLLINYFSQKRQNLLNGKLVFILLIFLNITFLFSRAGYALYLVTIVFIIWQTRNRYLKTYGLLFFLLVVTLLFSIMVYKRITVDKMNVKNSSDLARISVLKAGINMILKSPFYGVGYKAAADRFAEFEDKNIPGLVLVSTIHNIYINVFAEQGIIGFTLYLLLNFGLLFNLWKRICLIKLIRDKKDELFCFVSLAVFMIHGIVYHTFDYDAIYWVIIAMCIVVLRDTRFPADGLEK
jgi:O-antigen ligase